MVFDTGDGFGAATLQYAASCCMILSVTIFFFSGGSLSMSAGVARCVCKQQPVSSGLGPQQKSERDGCGEHARVANKHASER